MQAVSAPWIGRVLKALLYSGRRSPGRRGALLAKPAHDEQDVFAGFEARVGLAGPEADGKVAKRLPRQPDRLVERARLRDGIRLHSLDYRR